MVKTRYVVAVNEADIDPGRLKKMLDTVGVHAEEVSTPGRLGVYSVTVPDDLLGVERLRSELRKQGVESLLRQERTNSESEILAAPLLAWRISREKGYSGPRYGTEYMLDDACVRCGTGARPTGDVILKESDVPKGGGAFRTLDGEYFVSNDVREAIVDAGMTGAEFHDVLGVRTGQRLPWAQLSAPDVLPPFEEESSGGVRRESPCPTCERDGYFTTAESPLELRYRLTEDELREVPDFASTWEHFGRSRLADPFPESYFAQPLVLVKPTVVALLKHLKVRGVWFDPVATD